MHRGGKGFTLIELISVIAALGILISISAIGYSRFQADARDSQRSSKAMIISEALEKYYDKNGEYPGCETLGQPVEVIASQVLPGTPSSTFTTPGSSVEQTNSLRCEILALDGDDIFEYTGDGSSTCAAGASCLSYTVRFKAESTNTIQSIESRRQTSIATSNAPVLSVGAITTDTVNVNWSPSPNASSYRIQRAANNTFTSNVTDATSTSNSTAFNSLTQGTQHFFRVAGISGATQTAWSNVVSATTLSIIPPTITCQTVSSSSQILVSWNAIPGATNYRLQLSANPGFTSPTTHVVTGTSRVETGLTLGTLYYWRIQTVTGGIESNWSATCSAGPVLAPTNVSASSSTCGQITLSWTASSGATSYTLERSTSSDFTNSTTTTVTGSGASFASGPGVTNYIRMFAHLGSATSASSPTVSNSATICQPAPYSISCSNNGSALTCTSNAVCPAGTTANYQWYANGGAWVIGDQHRIVSYFLNQGQGITISVNSRCYTGNTFSPWTGGNNSGSFTRPVDSPYLNALVRGSGTRRINASWGNVCNGYHELYLTQGSYVNHTTPLISGVSSPYSLTDTRVWNSTITANYMVRVQCNGVWSGWSNTQSLVPR